MEAYLKSVEEARLASKMELDAKAKMAKDKKDSEKAGKGTDGIEVPKISKEERKKNYDEAMKKVNELIISMKYEDALAFLPSLTDYPEKKAELEKKIADLPRLKTQYEQQLIKFNQD